MVAILPPEPGRPFAILDAGNETALLRVAPDIVIDTFKRHGALLLRGFALDLASFRGFARQFCTASVFNESPDRQLLDPDHHIQSVNGGNMAFPLHPELSREPWKPDACFFACLQAPSGGGQTTVCDGIEVVRHMPDWLRGALSVRRLLYEQTASPEVLNYWLGTSTPDDAALASPPSSCPYTFTRRGESVMRGFSRPALHTPLFSDELAFGNFLLFARFFLGRGDFPVFDDGRAVPETWLQELKRISDAITVPVAWRNNDVLMLDNTRFMHGRTAIRDTAERLIATYFGYLNFAPINLEEPIDPPWREQSFRPPTSVAMTA